MDKLSKHVEDNMKVDIVSTDQMTSEERDKVMNSEATIDAIPDLTALTRGVYEILQYLEKPEISQRVKTNESEVRMYLNQLYANTIPHGIITLLMDEENRIKNVEQLLKLFEQLNKAKQGIISLDEAEKNVSDSVNQRYIYSKYGSRELFESSLDKKK